MTLTPPETMDGCLYFTNRVLDPQGNLLAWVHKEECSACHKAKMGKPVVKGKVKIRAKEYECPECGHTEEKTEHEESCTLHAVYTCPACGKDGEGSTPYKRKSYKGVQAFLIECQHCQEKIPITKKLKAIKKKKKK